LSNADKGAVGLIPALELATLTLYIRMKMTEEVATTQVAWVLLYVQGGIAEAWKDNLLDKLAKGESEVELAEQLFTKIRNNFGETSEEERKIEQLRMIEQGGRTCDEYVQEFKKVMRGSGYERRPLIEEFKRGLNVLGAEGTQRHLNPKLR